MVVPAQMTRDRPAGPDDGPDDPGSGPAPAAPPIAPPPPAAGGVGQLPRSGGSPPSQGGASRSPAVDLPPIEGPPGIDVPALPANPQDEPPTVEALPSAEPGAAESSPDIKPPAISPLAVPIIPGSQRVTFIDPRSGRELDIHKVATTPEGLEVYVIRNGVRIIADAPGKFGVVDIEADQAVIWRGPEPEEGQTLRGPNGEYIEDANRHPMEVYLEGNVILRQDQRKWAGQGDQRTLRAPRLYYNFLTDRFVAPNAEIDFFAPGLLAPMRVKSPLIEQFHELLKQPDGTFEALRAPQDPRRPCDDDRQPVPRARLQDLPEVDRPDPIC